MFLTETQVKRRDGRVVKYLHLLESVRIKGEKHPKHKLVYSFGRLDKVNRNSLYRLANNILDYLGTANDQPEADADFIWSRPLGIAHMVDSLAGKLGLTGALKQQIRGRKFEMPVLDAVLGMLTNRLDDPCAKLGVLDYLQNDVHFPAADRLQLHHFYRALDFLEEARDTVEDELYWRTRNLFNRRVDLVLYDATSTYVEGSGEDDLLQYGYSRDRRPDRRQIVIGLATDSDGLPLASAVFPGNTMDINTVEAMLQRVKKLRLGRIIFVCDRGMVSRDNLKELRGRNYDYLVGVKLRGLTEVRDRVLAQKGRYRLVRDNLQVKEVFLDERRYVICLNPKERQRDRHIRQELIAQLEKELATLKDPSRLLSHPLKRRFLRRLKSGSVRLNRNAIRAEARYDGKYVLLTTDRQMNAADLALSYKGLYRIERAFRDLKHTVNIRPLHHWTQPRIRAHVSLCVLAYFFQRWAELRTGLTWRQIYLQLRRVQAIKVCLKTGDLIRRTRLSKEQQLIYKQLDIDEPWSVLGS